MDESVDVVNWNGGHRQVIADHYDNPDVSGHLGKWLDAARWLPGVDGAMYTTWRSGYSNLDRFHSFPY